MSFKKYASSWTAPHQIARWGESLWFPTIHEDARPEGEAVRADGSDGSLGVLVVGPPWSTMVQLPGRM